MSTSRSDYQQEQAGAVLSRPHALAVIVKGWRRFAPRRPTLVFNASVAQANQFGRDVSQ
jgi:hypothetical protein